MIETCIITPTWNNEDYTIRCFDSIQKNTKDYKILWVENGSGLESKDRVKKFLDENNVPYELIQNEENLGFVKASNQGMKRAMELGAKYIVLQNNDTEVYDGWLDRMIEVAESDEKIGLIGPITSPCESWQSIENLTKNNPEFADFPKYNNPVEYSKEIKNKNDRRIVFVDDYLAFFSVLIKRDVIEDIGYLSEDFGVGLGDDNDYCARARKNGWRLALVKNVFVFHNHRTTFKSIYSDNEIKNMQTKAFEIIDTKKLVGSISDFRINDGNCPYCGKENVENEHKIDCKEKSPMISVIIPSRVGEEIISLSSLDKQTYEKLEIIVEYDEKKEGVSVVRNRGARKANGECLFFCDNDLILSPNCISDLYLALKSSPQAKWSFGKFYIDGSIYNENKCLEIPDLMTVDWVEYFEGMSTMSLVDASAQPRFDEAMLRYNDWDLWLTLSKSGYKAVFCDKILFVTNNRDGGISKFDNKDRIKWTNELYKKHNVFVFRDVHMKNKIILNLSENIQHRDNEIERRNHEIEEKNQEIERRNHEIEEKKQEIERRNHEIDIIKSSKFWKLRGMYMKIKNKTKHICNNL